MEHSQQEVERHVCHTFIFVIFVCIDLTMISVSAVGSSYLFYYDEYCASVVSTYLFSIVASSLSVLTVLSAEIIIFKTKKIELRFTHALIGLLGILALLANILFITWGRRQAAARLQNFIKIIKLSLLFSIDFK